METTKFKGFMPGQIIIIDGPDAVGKTTLANSIMKRVPNTKYLHLTYRFKDKIFDYHTAAIHLASKWSMKHNVIIDRWWPTEACYASVYRNTSSWPLQGRFHERVALKYGAIYVMALPDDNTIARHMRLKDERSEMYDDIADLCHLYLKFYSGDLNHKDKGNYIDQVILSGGLKPYNWYIPYTISAYAGNMDYFIDMIMEVGKMMRSEQWIDALAPSEHNILGHKKYGKYMFVGDQVNPKYNSVFWPFFEYGNSSLYLTEVLHNLWLKESECCFTNVKDKDGKLDLKYARAADEAGMDIIALGKTAEKALNEAKICPHHVMKHPSYYRRFNGKASDEMVRDLKDFI